MGLFFNYNKPGPGVEKDAPRRRGIFLYFELLWRYLGRLISSSTIYFLTSLPAFAVYFLMITFVFGTIAPEQSGDILMGRLALILAVLMTIFFGSGPASCGYAYVLRNMAREEHTWVFSDFFQKFKEGFLRGLIYFVVDAVVLMFMSVAMLTYGGMALESGGVFTALFVLSIFAFLLYGAMHFYLYQFEVTFSGSIMSVYKNSFIMALATMPMCLLISVLVYLSTTFVMSFLTPIAIVLLTFVCWMSFMRFGIDFYSARVIKSKIMPKFEKPEEDE